jgi:hypothetical protein
MTLTKILHSPYFVSVIHEAVDQELGKKPSHLFKHKLTFKHNASKDTLRYIKKHIHKPPHVFARRIAAHKQASGFATSVVESVVAGAKVAWQGASAAGTWAVAHSDDILKAAKVAGYGYKAVSAVGASAGWWSEEKRDSMMDTADLIDQYSTDFSEILSPEEKKGKEPGKRKLFADAPVKEAKNIFG